MRPVLRNKVDFVVFDDYGDIERRYAVQLNLMTKAMTAACWPATDVRRYERMSPGKQRKFDAEVAARGRSNHPHNAKFKRLYAEWTRLKVMQKLKPQPVTFPFHDDIVEPLNQKMLKSWITQAQQLTGVPP